MKDFITVFKYEFKTQLLKKAAIITTAVIIVIMLLVTSIPRLITLFDNGSGQGIPESGITGAGYVTSTGEAQDILNSILGDTAKPYPDRAALEKAKRPVFSIAPRKNRAAKRAEKKLRRPPFGGRRSILSFHFRAVPARFTACRRLCPGTPQA